MSQIIKEEKEMKQWQHKLEGMKRAIPMEDVRRTSKLQADNICDVAKNKSHKLCSQKFWSKQMLPEDNVTQDVVTLWCDNLKTFNISLGEKKSFELEHRFSKLQLTDSSTKALVGNKLENLRGRLGIHQHEKL